MRKLILLALCFCSTSLMAQTTKCYKDVCVDDYVRDAFGWGGEVVDINAEGVLSVSLFHYPDYISSFSYFEVGKLVNCHKSFCLKDKVIDQYGDEALIYEIYTNDVVALFYPNSWEDEDLFITTVEKLSL